MVKVNQNKEVAFNILINEINNVQLSFESPTDLTREMWSAAGQKIVPHWDVLC